MGMGFLWSTRRLRYEALTTRRNLLEPKERLGLVGELKALTAAQYNYCLPPAAVKNGIFISRSTSAQCAKSINAKR